MVQKDKEHQENLEKKDKDYQQLIEKKEVRALQENRHNQNRLDSAAAFHLQLAYSNQARVHETANVVHDFLTTNQQTLNTYGAEVTRTLPRDFKRPSSLKAVSQVRSGLNADVGRKRSVDDIADTYRPQPMDTKTVVPFKNMTDTKGFCHECGKAVKLVFDEQQLAEEGFVLTIDVDHARFELTKMSPGIPSLEICRSSNRSVGSADQGSGSCGRSQCRDILDLSGDRHDFKYRRRREPASISD
ncbi:hypothetical protein PI124_g14772 [Phytophthora idaei]|nr:hypothetical protein PI125_g12245 [Phytophthora idaei]KAG3161697.1 hypothetical protein PI126_g6316 [Phytophthora idaei]KAG3240325.1 hypothetical protein PI124_g14772 [Phytophthora idaei]